MNTPATFILNGHPRPFTPGETILHAAEREGLKIPTLCHDPRLKPAGVCRTCLVEVKGSRRLAPACATVLEPGMEVQTENDRVLRHRRNLFALYLADHPRENACTPGVSCDLHRMAQSTAAPADWPSLTNARPGPTRDRNRFIEFRADRCVACAKCTRYCEEVEGVSAITMARRGAHTTVSTADGRSLLDTTCEFCGGCIAVCPTGAMTEKAPLLEHTPPGAALEKVRTTCNYCGVGCQMDLQVDRAARAGQGRIVKVTHPPAGTVPNDGNLCVKGKFASDFIHHADRLTHPLVRGADGRLRQATWDEALARAATGLRAVQQRHGAAAVGFIASARCTCEENYLMQKIARACFETNNIHQCAALCHDPTVAGLALTLGAGAMTNSIAEIREADFLFVIGCNVTEAHPVIGMEMKRAARRGAKIVVADPREIWLTRIAQRHLRLLPGTDVWLLNALAHVIVAERLFDPDYVERHTENFEALKQLLTRYTPEEAERITGVPAAAIRGTAREYATTRKAGIYYTLGITEHISGVDNVTALSNLALLTGHLGYASTGVNPLRGQNNVQGANDSGASPDMYPGYQRSDDPAVRAKFAQAWNARLPDQPGLNLNQMMGLLGQQVKGLYLMGEDLAVSEPDVSHLEARLGTLECLVVQDIFLSETARFAHVVLPAACFAEKEGVFANTERRVQRVRKAVEPPGEARPDWRILADFANACGAGWQYASAAEIYAEMARLAPRFAGISHERLDREGGIQWPCPAPDHKGTQFLHATGPLRGKGLLRPVEFRPPAERAEPAYPLALSTGRTLFHYNAGPQTSRSEGIQDKQPENFLQLHPQDAAARQIGDGDMVVVRSRRGQVKARARVTEEVRQGCAWMPFHFVAARANLLTIRAGDAVTGTPEYKVCAVEVERAAQA